jgi:hypothetical protein
MFVQYIPKNNNIEISEGNRVLRQIPVWKLLAQINGFGTHDGILEAIVNDAQNNPAQKFLIPNTVAAKGTKARNYGAMGVRL